MAVCTSAYTCGTRTGRARAGAKRWPGLQIVGEGLLAWCDGTRAGLVHAQDVRAVMHLLQVGCSAFIILSLCRRSSRCLWRGRAGIMGCTHRQAGMCIPAAERLKQ